MYDDDDYELPPIDSALICTNGHEINSHVITHPKFNSKHCEKCGAEAIHQCPQCKAEIRGQPQGLKANFLRLSQ
jgi:hypothetical protein